MITWMKCMDRGSAHKRQSTEKEENGNTGDLNLSLRQSTQDICLDTAMPKLLNNIPTYLKSMFQTNYF